MVTVTLFKAPDLNVSLILDKLIHPMIRRRRKDNLIEGIRNAELLPHINLLSFVYFSESPRKIEILSPNLEPKIETVKAISQTSCLLFLERNTLAISARRPDDVENLLNLISDLVDATFSPIRFTSDFLLKVGTSLSKEVISANFVTPTSLAVVELRGNDLLDTKTFKQYQAQGQVTKIGFIPTIESPTIRIIRIQEDGKISISGVFDIDYIYRFLEKLFFLLS